MLPKHCTQKTQDCQPQLNTFFRIPSIYCQELYTRRYAVMWENYDPNGDLDDFIFEESSGKPSER